ncbi:hypothetical protein [Pontimicrobium sp. MEBiC01747]|jgi:hypothetical protein
MKKIFILLLGLSVFTSCKNDTNTTEVTTKTPTDLTEKTAKQNDGLTLLAGEFIYYADAAVLQSGSSVYGVIIDDKMHELYNMGKAFRKEATDGVAVQVRGKITPIPEGEEGWPYRIEIKEIVSVKALDPKANEVIKIGQ